MTEAKEKRLSKAQIEALGRVFAREIDGALPLQSKAKIYRELEAEGLLAPMKRTFSGGRLSVTITGYQLTHAGRFRYCTDC